MTQERTIRESEISAMNASIDSPIPHSCPECLATFKFKPQLSGKAVKCPKCKKPIRLPGTSESLVDVDRTPLKEPVAPRQNGTAILIAALVVAFLVCGVTAILFFPKNQAAAEPIKQTQPLVAQVSENLDYYEAVLKMELQRCELTSQILLEFEARASAMPVTNATLAFHQAVIDYKISVNKNVVDSTKKLQRINSIRDNIGSADRIPKMFVEYGNDGVDQITDSISDPKQRKLFAVNVGNCLLGELEWLAESIHSSANQDEANFISDMLARRVKYAKGFFEKHGLDWNLPEMEFEKR